MFIEIYGINPWNLDKSRYDFIKWEFLNALIKCYENLIGCFFDMLCHDLSI